MPSFLMTILSFLSGPIVNALLDGYKAKLAREGDRDRVAAEIAVKEVELQVREAELRNQLRIAQIGHWTEPEYLFGYVMVIYFAKVILWDKVLGLGVTDPIGGSVAEWAGLIMSFYFGKRTIENVLRIWKA